MYGREGYTGKVSDQGKSVEGVSCVWERGGERERPYGRRRSWWWGVGGGGGDAVRGEVERWNLCQCGE